MTNPVLVSKEAFGWKRALVSAKHPEGANVRFSPYILSHNVYRDGKILHAQYGKTTAFVNPLLAHKDGVYTWWPIIPKDRGFDGESQYWVASEILEKELFEDVVLVPPVEEPEEPPPANEYTVEEESLVAAYRRKDFKVIYLLCQEFVQFKDIAFGEYTVAVPEPIMNVLGETLVGLGNFLINDEEQETEN